MTIQGGFYIMARSIEESEISRCSPAVREIWHYLIREANHKSASLKSGVKIERGQLLRSYLDIRNALCWYVGYRKMTYSEDVTKKAMKKLRELLMITTANALGGIVITVCNYDIYQNIENYEGTTKKLEEGTAHAPIPHSGGTPKNKNEERIRKNEEIYNAVSDIVDYLNFKLGRDPKAKKGIFKASTDATQKSINSRLKEGYSLQDFKDVIDVKVSQWKGTDNERYLCPETLFRPSHFEKYLVESTRTIPITSSLSTAHQLPVFKNRDEQDEYFNGPKRKKNS